LLPTKPRFARRFNQHLTSKNAGPTHRSPTNTIIHVVFADDHRIAIAPYPVPQSPAARTPSSTPNQNNKNQIVDSVSFRQSSSTKYNTKQQKSTPAQLAALIKK
jgi:hypothetical protein